MVTIKERIANSENHGGKRATSKIKYIVIHYTANDGDTDEANGNYFKNNIVKASAHYFVDSDSITRSVPDDYVAWSVGGNKYNNCAQTGGGKYYGKCTNENSISIELCDDVKNNAIYPSSATINNAIDLTKMLMKKYNIGINCVIRHFDVNGKACPAYWCGDATKNKKWLTAFKNKLGSTAVKSEASNKSDGAASGYKVKVTANALNIRSGAGMDYKVVGCITDKGVYTIVQEKNGWGKLKSGAGWISLKYTTKI